MPRQNQVDVGDYDFSSPFLFGEAGPRLIQVQPLVKCNLHCLHCYSESGPKRDDKEIPFQLLERLLPEAADIGYNYVGVSGGEPLLWSSLAQFLELAKEYGYSTSVSTNGTLLTKDRADELKGLAGLVAVSVDGPPEEHAKLRRSETAFDRMLEGLSVLRDANVPFTLAFTLTKYNANRLAWLYDFAIEVQAQGVHVHPLSAAGAAATNLPDAIPDSLEFEVASLLMALVIQEKGKKGPAVFFDVIERSTVERSNWPLLGDHYEDLLDVRFTELVPALIVEPDGCLVPFTYGFPRKWSLGKLGDLPVDTAAKRWREQSAISIASQMKSTLDRLATNDAKYIDLFGELMISAKRNESAEVLRKTGESA